MIKGSFRLFFKPAMEIALVFTVFIALSGQVYAESPVVSPFQSPETIDSGKTKAIGTIDRLVIVKLQKEGIPPARLCSDEVFVRRVFLDIIGTLPEAWEVRDFLKDQRPNKRAILINKLLKRDEFADYWSLKWCDLLRVKAEFPINLWPNAVQAYHRWIHDCLADNMPYDKFVRLILISSGSNFRQPQVNFYRAIQGHDPQTIAKAAALNFMGIRLEKLSKKQQQSMEALFSGIAYKSTAEWKEEIVYYDPNFKESAEVVFPDGRQVTILPGQDRRMIFADWLITDKNPYFCRNIVNRIWAWLLTRGIIEDPDDIFPGNNVSNPELLAYLEKELSQSGYDLRHIYSLILNSRTYQQSSIGQSKNPDAEKLFACYPVRQLDAEVLIDAICKLTGTTESYSSPIPEPFTFIPPDQRSIDLSDGSITSQFLEMFGRPGRDTGLESERNNQPTDDQRLFMLNSSHIQDKINQGWRLRNIIKNSQKDRAALLETIYITILSRYPTEEEKDIIIKYLSGKRKGLKSGVNDLIWALINSKEFLYRH